MALVRKAARQIQTLPSAADASAQLFPTSEVDLQKKERDERCEIRKLLVRLANGKSEGKSRNLDSSQWLHIRFPGSSRHIGAPAVPAVLHLHGFLFLRLLTRALG